MVRRQVNLKTIIIKRLKNNLKGEIFVKSFSTFTEKLIIIYTIIHELSGTKRREYIIENILQSK
jgi:hypothetical protein